MDTALSDTTLWLQQCWDEMINQPSSALAHAEKALAVLDESEAEFVQALGYCGLCEMYLGHYDSGIRQLSRALTLMTIHGHQEHSRLINNALGMCHQAMGRFGAALDHYEFVVEQAREQNNIRALIPSLVNMTSMYLEMGHLDVAEQSLNEILGYDLSQIVEDNRVEIYLLQSQILISAFRFEEADLVLTLTETLAADIGFRYAQLRASTLRGRWYRLQGQLKSAISTLAVIVQDDAIYEEAREAIDAVIEYTKALFSAEQMRPGIDALLHCKKHVNSVAGSPQNIRLVEHLAHAFHAIGDYKNEVAYLRELHRLEHSVTYQRTSNILELREVHRRQANERINQQVKDRENQLLKASHDRLNLLNDFAHQITQTLNFKDLGQRLYQILSDHMGVHFVSLVTLTDSKDVLEYQFAMDSGKPVIGRNISMSEEDSHTVQALKSLRPVNIANAGHLVDKRKVGSGEVMPESMLFVPLVLEEEVLGVFSMQSPVADRFQQVELQMMLPFSKFVSIATSNILAHEKVRQLNSILHNEKQAIIDAQERIEHMAYHDALTSLPNRQALEEFLDRRIIKATSQFHLVYIDLDGFKPVNDQHGHRLGDLVLVEIAKRVKESLRMHDFAARVGGDEFVLIIDARNDAYGLERFLERLLSVIEEPVSTEHGDIHMSASIGSARYPDKGRNLDALMHNADLAMYEIKRSGKGGFKTS